MTNTELLNEYIRKSGLRIGYICEILGITRQAFNKKRKNISRFTAAEVYVLCDILHITDDKDRIFLPSRLK